MWGSFDDTTVISASEGIPELSCFHLSCFLKYSFSEDGLPCFLACFLTLLSFHPQLCNVHYHHHFFLMQSPSRNLEKGMLSSAKALRQASNYWDRFLYQTLRCLNRRLLEWFPYSVPRVMLVFDNQHTNAAMTGGSESFSRAPSPAACRWSEGLSSACSSCPRVVLGFCLFSCQGTF